AGLTILRGRKEWADQARDLLRRQLEQPKLTAEERRALQSLLVAFQEQASIQDLIAAALRRDTTPVDHRIALLETLAQSDLKKLPKSWSDALRHSLASSEASVRAAAVRAVAILQMPELDDVLERLAEAGGEPLPLRLEALRAIVLRRP